MKVSIAATLLGLISAQKDIMCSGSDGNGDKVICEKHYDAIYANWKEDETRHSEPVKDHLECARI